MNTDKTNPKDYYSETDYPIGGNHPKYPDIYRVSTTSANRLYALHMCDECPMHDTGCDRSCGFAKVWVGPVTWIRIRMTENQA